MAKIALTLESLQDLDMGKVATAWKQDLERLVRDCMDRPGDTTSRTLNLKLTLVPEQDDTGACEVVSGEFEIIARTPPRRSRKYEMQVHGSGSLLVNPESPSNIRQRTLDEVEE